MSTPEGKVKKSITDWLDKNNIYWERRVAQGGSYKKGLPDLWCIVNGKHIEIETKADKGHLSTMQEKFKSYFESINVIYIVAKSVEDIINKIGNI